ncbi:MAG: 4-phosphoerythronate dehydrogenase [Bacteroidales bacterium]|nr:4-phosphoerythronate dehydrogenase [Bacteroidales bacterium]
MKIVADDKIPFLKGVLEPYAEVVYLPGNQIQNSTLKNADALLTRSITICNEELLQNSNVKIIASATIGDDHIDKVYCKKAGIKWSTAKGCNAGAVAQYVATALLHVANKKQIELADKTIGIVGVGNIGSKVQRIANLFAMKVLLNDPPRERNEGKGEFTSIGEIQEKADFVSLHVPLTYGGVDKTFHLADSELFKGFAKPVHFINTSRGAVGDTDVLKSALVNSMVKTATLDVWENEPDIDRELLDVSAIASPHIAGYTLEGKANGTAFTVQAVSKCFNLGLDSWYPGLPVESRTIEFDCASLSDQEIFHKIFDQVYPIQKDDMELRNNPDHFEQLRRDYVFRRENNTFILDIRNVSDELTELLKKLGFEMK